MCVAVLRVVTPGVVACETVASNIAASKVDTTAADVEREVAGT